MTTTRLNRAAAVRPVGPKSAGLVVCYYDGSNYHYLIGNESKTSTGQFTIGTTKKFLNKPERTKANLGIHWNYSNKTTQSEAEIDFCDFTATVVSVGQRIQFKDLEPSTTHGIKFKTEFREKGTKYGFPTGGSKSDEHDLETAALREATEEIGFNFTVKIDHSRLINLTNLSDDGYEFFLLCINVNEFNAINECIDDADHYHYGELFDRKFVTSFKGISLNTRSSNILNKLYSKIGRCNAKIVDKIGDGISFKANTLINLITNRPRVIAVPTVAVGDESPPENVYGAKHSHLLSNKKLTRNNSKRKSKSKMSKTTIGGGRRRTRKQKQKHRP